jgi:hypothetical protein
VRAPRHFARVAIYSPEHAALLSGGKEVAGLAINRRGIQHGALTKVEIAAARFRQVPSPGSLTKQLPFQVSNGTTRVAHLMAPVLR